MMTNELPDMLTVKDLMAYLNLSQTSAYNLVNRKDFPTIKLSDKCIRVRKDSLLKWLNKNQENTL